jgi:uridine kinase
MGPLLPSTEAITRFAMVPDDDGCVLLYGKHGAPHASVNRSLAAEARAASRHVEVMTREHSRWLQTLGMTSVGAFNQACLRGDVTQLIRVVEGYHEKRIGQMADEISERSEDLKVVCIAGPSSSGKTTTIKRLKVQLQVNGIHPVEVSLDNYYVDREDNPRDEDGDYDFEAFEALRADLLQEHLASLLTGEAVTTARYDFTTGRSFVNGGPTIALGESDILMLEGIHGLNPRLLSAINAENIFRIYICPLAQLPFDRVTRVHSSDVRLLRRIVRGRRYRGASAAQTIARWPSVRRGERRHIYPFQLNADAVFDSSLIYEPSVLKVFAEQYLLEVPRDAPEYTTAFRLLQLLDRFVTIYPDQVPPTSLLREFIGGSGFSY